jgi:hypothetical protein
MMTKLKTDNKPVGAVSFEDEIGPFWVVYYTGLIERRTVKPYSWFYPKGFPIDQMGWAFKNYFHAYAYSLKCKEAARVRDYKAEA